MADTRPVLLGMHNPLSDHPKLALWPEPRGCTGWRIWQMVGCSKIEYIRGFDRRNLLDSEGWMTAAARSRAQDIWPTLEGRRVVLLGREVASCIGLPAGDWLLPEIDVTGREWRVVPHPSGRNRLYNDPTMGVRVSMLLRDLWERYGQCPTS